MNRRDLATLWRRAPGALPLVLGHRGARHAAPENTLAAFQLAAREGASGVELDVRLDASGEAVVIHDPNLGRVTDGRDRRAVHHLSTAELGRVNVGAGETVPTLQAVLTWACREQLRVNVEVKHDVVNRFRLVKRVAEIVDAMPAAKRSVLVSSFHPGVVWQLARRLPQLPVAWLVEHQRRWLRRAPGWRLLGASGVNPEHSLVTPERLERWQRAGALVTVWTVNDATTATRLAKLGVDALISDTPGAVIQALGSG